MAPDGFTHEDAQRIIARLNQNGLIEPEEAAQLAFHATSCEECREAVSEITKKLKERRGQRNNGQLSA